MALDGLVFGLLDTSGEIGDPDLAARARSWTLSWSRFKYFGPILEDDGVERLLDRALVRGFRHLFVQPSGHFIVEAWNPEHRGGVDFLASLEDLARTADTLVVGGLPGAFLVDLESWERFGRPVLQSGAPFPPALASCMLSLQPENPARAAELRRLLAVGSEAEASGVWSPAEAHFLNRLQVQIENARRGIFVWNFEPYSDVEEPPPGFVPPISSLYSVGAGLKANRILETHGFDAATRVVFFDYSQKALDFKRRLRDEWDGRDYPSFLRRLFREVPPGEAFYWLWGDATPAGLDWSEVERHWRRELAAWGGEDVLAGHWARYRELAHEFVPCNLLSEPERLVERFDDRPGAVIWWSNAFCTVYSNWLYTVAERRRIYERFLDALAERSPDLFLYGSDAANISVNCTRAAAYRSLYQEGAGSGDPDLEPRKVHRHEIRF